jgi:hypothetical protein
MAAYSTIPAYAIPMVPCPTLVRLPIFNNYTTPELIAKGLRVFLIMGASSVEVEQCDHAAPRVTRRAGMEGTPNLRAFSSARKRISGSI